MSTLSFNTLEIRGTWASVPGEPLDVRTLGAGFTEAELERAIGSIGLDKIHRVRPGQTTADLCIDAARRLLNALAWEPQSLDGLIFVTQTPDYVLPGNAHIVHRELGLGKSTFAIDIALGCSGFPYALCVANGLLGGGARRVLILAGDTVSALVDPADKGTALLFGDAGTATAVEYSDTAQPATYVLGADGTGANDLIVEQGGFRCPPGAPVTSGSPTGARVLAMNGIAIFAFTSREVPELVRGLVRAAQWELDHVDRIYLHQANGMIIDLIRKKLAVPEVVVPKNINRFGNTSVASLPLLLADPDVPLPSDRGRSRVIFAGFGVGFSWSAVALELSTGIVRGLSYS